MIKLVKLLVAVRVGLWQFKELKSNVRNWSVHGADSNFSGEGLIMRSMRKSCTRFDIGGGINRNLEVASFVNGVRLG